MGENNKEIIMNCLKGWHSLSLKQREALSQGNLEEFEKLAKVSVLLQARLDKLLPGLKPGKIDQTSLHLLKEIQDIQSGLISELQDGARKLSEEIGELRKNTDSLKGYRQPSSRLPHFKNEQA